MRTMGAKTDEVRRLLRRCSQHEHAVERLSNAVMILRRGNDALREENRLLRLELERRDRSQPAYELRT